MKKWFGGLFLVSFLFSILFACGSSLADNTSEGLGVRRKIEQYSGLCYITIDDVTILDDTDWKDIAAKKGNGVFIVGIFATIENDVSYKYAIDTLEDIDISVLDQDGFKLEKGYTYLGAIGRYVNAKVKPGEKGRSYFTYYVYPETTEIVIKRQGEWSIKISLEEGNQQPSDSKEAISDRTVDTTNEKKDDSPENTTIDDADTTAPLTQSNMADVRGIHYNMTVNNILEIEKQRGNTTTSSVSNTSVVFEDANISGRMGNVEYNGFPGEHASILEIYTKHKSNGSNNSTISTEASTEFDNIESELVNKYGPYNASSVGNTRTLKSTRVFKTALDNDGSKHYSLVKYREWLIEYDDCWLVIDLFMDKTEEKMPDIDMFTTGKGKKIAVTIYNKVSYEMLPKSAVDVSQSLIDGDQGNTTYDDQSTTSYDPVFVYVPTGDN